MFLDQYELTTSTAGSTLPPVPYFSIQWPIHKIFIQYKFLFMTFGKYLISFPLCIGKRNYRFFFQFLAFLCLHMISIFACCLIVVLNRPINTPPVIASISLAVLAGLLLFPIGGLFVFHIVLISNGRTTNEHVTGKYRGMNFFSRGLIRNFAYLFCGSLSAQLKAVELKKRKKVVKKAASTEKVNVNASSDGAVLIKTKSKESLCDNVIIEVDQKSLGSNATNRGMCQLLNTNYFRKFVIA